MAALRFRPDLRVLVLALCAIPLCFGLGLWQLDRKAEKEALLDADRQTRLLAPIPLEGMNRMAVAGLPSGRQVRLRGRYSDDRVVLLDNRVHEGRVGYEVLMRFTLTDGRSVVVNRGWTPAGMDRQDLPSPAAPAGELAIAGVVYRPPGAPLLLGENLSSDGGWPRLAQVGSLPADHGPVSDQGAGGPCHQSNPHR